MDHLWLNNDGWILIFYTGKDELSSAITFNGNVKLIKSRPNLDVSTQRNVNLGCLCWLNQLSSLECFESFLLSADDYSQHYIWD